MVGVSWQLGPGRATSCPEPDEPSGGCVGPPSTSNLVRLSGGLGVGKCMVGVMFWGQVQIGKMWSFVGVRAGKRDG